MHPQLYYSVLEGVRGSENNEYNKNSGQTGINRAFQRRSDMAIMAATTLLPLLFAGGVYTQYVPVPWAYTQPEPPVKVTVDATVRHQTMIGGGCSGAFGVACDQTGSKGLSLSNQQLVSDYLFNENVGGLSILRNRVGSSPTDGILGGCPQTPSAPANYTGLGKNESTDSCRSNRCCKCCS